MSPRKAKSKTEKPAKDSFVSDLKVRGEVTTAGDKPKRGSTHVEDRNGRINRIRFSTK